MNATSHRYRARKRGAQGSFTAEEFLALGDKCVYCGVVGPMTADHMIPISRGGSNDISNIAPACKPCNSSKRDMTSEEFLKSHRLRLREELKT